LLKGKNKMVKQLLHQQMFPTQEQLFLVEHQLVPIL
jgi:hypothetical protein